MGYGVHNFGRNFSEVWHKAKLEYTANIGNRKCICIIDKERCPGMVDMSSSSQYWIFFSFLGFEDCISHLFMVPYEPVTRSGWHQVSRNDTYHFWYEIFQFSFFIPAIAASNVLNSGALVTLNSWGAVWSKVAVPEPNDLKQILTFMCEYTDHWRWLAPSSRTLAHPDKLVKMLLYK